MKYIVCDFTNGIGPIEEYHFYEEACAELERLQQTYPDYKFGIEEAPDVEDIENDYDD